VRYKNDHKFRIKLETDTASVIAEVMELVIFISRLVFLLERNYILGAVKAEATKIGASFNKS
jgi:hypothetical protein